ncbi:uncharacterized protein B0I36DRAFT_313077 [Microdochium trichocladiopsis]|uniref:Adenine deaminase n=1 Tax=Microdochium trichocladiopsis TaxID=1682393 RepID=A0A9P8YM91_9PEZI|nr:uncharacterized protein B0I36DRAFT_313077 [Microdochium trichocladiopsis]KAH7041590.1 hypothetical protein B0I36DRAFT_313077 [Microdochium trichocladiopsis]
MCKSDLHQFLAELPKCEHHLHLEGCLSPKLVFKLAAKNNVELPDPKTSPAYESPETLEKRYEHFDNLEDFLQCHYRAMRVLVMREDFAMLGWEYFAAAHADGVKHAEVFFDPQSHTSRDIPFGTVVAGYRDACDRAERELGITSRLIMCFLRHLPVESAAETMRSAVDGGYFDGDSDDARAIAALGLDSSEVGFPPELFREMYAEAKRLGVHRTAHGGEEGDPSYISGVLDALHGERVDHGVRLVEDPELMRRVVAEKILLTLCPLSNVCLQVVKDVSELPIKTFLDAGVRFSINSDDPAYFHGYILNNYCAVQKAFNFGIKEWKLIAENSVNGSWIGEARRSQLLAMIEDCVSKFSV